MVRGTGATNVMHASSTSSSARRVVGERPTARAVRGNNRGGGVARRVASSASASSSSSSSSDAKTNGRGRGKPWAVALANVFDWEDVRAVDAEFRETRGVEDDGEEEGEECVTPAEASTRGEGKYAAPSRGCKEEFVVIDGANVAWSLAQKLKSRFKTPLRVPMSAAVLAALNYEPWESAGISTHAFIPREYVVGYVNSVCDGGSLAAVNSEIVEYLGKGMWCNRRLMDEVEKGRLTLVSREGKDGRGLRKADDLKILQIAKEADAWVCSNDKFRDHRRERGIGFSGGKALKEFARLRRFDHNFLIAPGLDDQMLEATLAASGWTPKVGASHFPDYDGPRRRAIELDADAPRAYHAMPHSVLPVYFEPLPTDSMKTARRHFLERRNWSVARLDNHDDAEI